MMAFAWGQVFGGARGFVCDCGGEVEVTFVDHCHGPHGAECHAEEHENDPCHDVEDHAGEEGETQHHEPNEDLVKAGPGLAQVSLPMAPAPEMLPMAELFVTFPQQLGAAALSRREVGRSMDGATRWPQVLKRQIALQV